MAKEKTLTPEQREAARERCRKYNSKPEVVAKRKAYYQRPEVKQRYKDRANTERQKAYMKEWRQSESGKASLKAAGLRQRAFTLEMWETLRRLQGNACAICRRPFGDDLRKIHADHCHDTKEPRGLLCQNCNHAEGQIKKTGLTPEEFAKRLQHYLDSPPAVA